MTILPRFMAGRSFIVLGALAFAVSGLERSGDSCRAAEPPSTKVSTDPSQSLRRGDPRSHGIKDVDLDVLRATLRKALEDKTVPGVSLLLSHQGEIIFKEAFGNIAVDQKVHMASSSKPVTATMIMILADQKRLGLDDPIERFLPEFKGIKLKGKPPAKLPTVRHLLCNMSGLPGDFLAESLLKRLRKGPGKDQDEVVEKEKRNSEAGFFSRPNRSLAESVRVLAETGLATEPGAEFHYCTMGFNVAARVAEVAAKRPFEELIRAELLDPMGMNETRYTPFGMQALNPNSRLPSGESRFIMAGGGMTSTLDDFAAFYQMHLNGGTYRDRRILSDQSTATMHTRQAKLELLMAGPYGNDYGLAFFLDKLDEKGQAHVITHPGLFGTTPWFDEDRELVGVLFVQSNFLRVISLVRDIQAQVRQMVPAKKTMSQH
jgi:CubicO group peptidase (beta-lactamase class C family)